MWRMVIYSYRQSFLTKFTRLPKQIKIGHARLTQNTSFLREEEETLTDLMYLGRKTTDERHNSATRVVAVFPLLCTWRNSARWLPRTEKLLFSKDKGKGGESKKSKGAWGELYLSQRCWERCFLRAQKSSNTRIYTQKKRSQAVLKQSSQFGKIYGKGILTKAKLP